MLLQQCPDPLAHPLIPLVDEFLSEVAVYFLGGHLLTGWQCHIIEVRDLKKRKVQSEHEGEKKKEKSRFSFLVFYKTPNALFWQSG